MHHVTYFFNTVSAYTKYFFSNWRKTFNEKTVGITYEDYSQKMRKSAQNSF